MLFSLLVEMLTLLETKKSCLAINGTFFVSDDFHMVITILNAFSYATTYAM